MRGKVSFHPEGGERGLAGRRSGKIFGALDKHYPTKMTAKCGRSFLVLHGFWNSLFQTVCRRARRHCIILFLLVVLLALYSNWVLAAGPQCGDPPTVTNERVKGEVEVKAKAISKIIGALGFGGAYEKSREDIFSKYDDSNAARADQYFYFLVCNVVLQSTAMTDREKVDILFKMKSVAPGGPTTPRPGPREFRKPSSDSGDPQSTRNYWRAMRTIDDKYQAQAFKEIEEIKKILNDRSEAFSKVVFLARSASKKFGQMVYEERNIPLDGVDNELAKFEADGREKFLGFADGLNHFADVGEQANYYGVRGQRPPEYLKDQLFEALRKIDNAWLGMQELVEEERLLKAKLVEKYGEWYPWQASQP